RLSQNVIGGVSAGAGTHPHTRYSQRRNSSRARILTPPPAPAPRTPSHTVYLHKQTLRVTLWG
ncbi:hypothetical protein BMG523Draft_03872, partial [Frankia sp. BMG5.23]